MSERFDADRDQHRGTTYLYVKVGDRFEYIVQQIGTSLVLATPTNVLRDLGRRRSVTADCWRNGTTSATEN